MSTKHTEITSLVGATVVTPDLIQAAMQRGRRERSLAFWAMMQAVFGRRDEADHAHLPQASDRTAAIAR